LSERVEAVYWGDRLREVAMPLGGIGAGSIALAGDGSLSQWQIFNHVNKEARIPDSFFAVWARPQGGEAVRRVLQTRPLGFPDYPPCVDALEYVGEYPIARLRYLDPELPVAVELEAFSPFIPLNPKDSGLPVIVFIFSVGNTGRKPVDVALIASLQNAVGYDGFSPMLGNREQVENVGYGGNVNRVVKRPGLTAVHMTSTGVEGDSPNFGTMTLATLSGEASYLSQWTTRRTLWLGLQDGRLGNVEASEPSGRGKTWNGSLCVSLALGPGEKKTAVFLVAWHFPNRLVDWQPLAEEGYRLGNMYNNWFGDSLAVAEYVAQNFERLCGETRLFHDAFYGSTLPRSLLDRVGSQLSTIRSPTCMWFEDGGFVGFEGCGRDQGCCPLNCTHVWNYEQALARVFPSLERRMRETDLGPQMEEDGLIHHRTFIPLSRPRASGPATDGHLGTILKAYREHLQSADRSFLDEVWPRVKKALEFIIREWDPDRDGLITCAQPNTYDIAIYGANTFTGSLYLAALRAAEEMAKIEGEPEAAKLYRGIYERGRAKLDSETWNGEYYIQKYDEEMTKDRRYGRWRRTYYDTGCLSDQLLGQWWAHVLNLGYVMLREHVQKALESIVRYNWRSLTGFHHSQRAYACGGERGLLNCTWPRGGKPDQPIFYCDEVWTGVEYQVAAHLIYEGRVEEALRIVDAVHERHDGRRRNPWDEPECGSHYVRAMSSWSLLLAAEGYVYDGPRGLLGFRPRLSPQDFRALFTAAGGWGTFTQRRQGSRQVETIRVEYGSLRLRELLFQPPGPAAPRDVSVLVDARRVEANWKAEGDEVHIALRDGLHLERGETLQIIISR